MERLTTENIEYLLSFEGQLTPEAVLQLLTDELDRRKGKKRGIVQSK